MRALVNRCGHALASLGLELEQRVTLLLPDSPELAALFFGAMKIGAIPIPTNTLLRPPDYRYMLEDSRSRVLVVSTSLWPSVEPILGDARWLRAVAVVDDAGSGVPDVPGLAVVDLDPPEEDVDENSGERDRHAVGHPAHAEILRC